MNFLLRNRPANENIDYWSDSNRNILHRINHRAVWSGIRAG
jgi:hypothetical protein